MINEIFFFFLRALPAGAYLVRVYVNGNIIPLYQYLNIKNAYIQVNKSK